MQVDPINSELKPPGTERLKLEYDKLPSSFTFKFNLRRYSVDLNCGCPANVVTGKVRPCSFNLSNPF